MAQCPRNNRSNSRRNHQATGTSKSASGEVCESDIGIIGTGVFDGVDRIDKAGNNEKYRNGASATNA